MAIRNNTFLLKRSNVIDKIPTLTGLTIGELALNTADAKLYSLYTSGMTGATEVRQIGWDRLSTISGGTVSGNSIFISGVTGNTFNISSVPTNNNSNTQILTRNSSSGNVEYRDVSSISGGGGTGSTSGSFGVYIDGNNNVITTGTKGFLIMPYNGTINEWVILSDQIGNLLVDIWKDTIINYPPTSADTITGGNYPYLSSQITNHDNVLTGWSTNFLKDDVFVFNVLSADTVTNINLTINVTKT